MDEDPAEVLGVLLHPVVQRLDLLLVEEAQHALLELAGALAGDDLDERRLLRHGLVDDRAQGAVDVPAAVVDVVQVELQLHVTHPPPRGRVVTKARPAAYGAGTQLSASFCAELCARVWEARGVNEPELET